MTGWAVKCAECGVKERIPGDQGNLNIEQAKAWAAEWEKKHWEVCSERKKGSEAKA